MKSLARLLSALVILVHTATQAAVTVSMDSTAGDPIGQGKHWQLNDQTGNFVFTNNVVDAGGAKIISMSFVATGTEPDWKFLFSARPYLEVASYMNADTFSGNPFTPFISISRAGTGCPNTGWYVVHEIQFNGEQITQLALDFTQQCLVEGQPQPPLIGSIRVNSTVPLPKSGPVAVVAAANVVQESALVTLTGDTSFVTDAGSIQRFSWSQVAGPSVTLSSPTSSSTSFVAPSELEIDGVDIKFKLIVTDNLGRVASSIRTVHVQSKSDPRSWLTFDSDADDVIGQGSSFNLTDDNALFESFESSPTRGLISSAPHVSYHFGKENGEALRLGLYRLPEDISAKMLVSVANRSCPTDYYAHTGWFDVSLIKPPQFRVNFEQHCGMASASSRGELAVNIRHDSVPTALIEGPSIAFHSEAVALDASTSTDADGTIVQWRWRQLKGRPLLLTHSDSSVMSVTMPNDVMAGRPEELWFELRIKDDLGYMDKKIHKLYARAPNVSPVAMNDEAWGVNAQPFFVSLTPNDIDPEHALDRNSITILDAPSHGSWQAQFSNGGLLYTANAGYVGRDSFTYQIKDRDGASSNIATVVVHVLASNAAPTAVDDSVTTMVNQAIGITVLANDVDNDEAGMVPETLYVTTEPQNGTLIQRSGGVITYTPNSGFSGTDHFTYKVADKTGSYSADATVTIKVTDGSDGSSGGVFGLFSLAGLLLARLTKRTTRAISKSMS